MTIPESVVAVTVDTPEPVAEPEADAPETVVVVVEPESEPVSEPGADPLTERLVLIEQRLAQVEDVARSAEWKAEDAENAASVAIDIAIDTEEAAAEADADLAEAVDETLEETLDEATIDDKIIGDDTIEVPDSVEPVSARVHPLFRSFSDWRNR